MNWNEASDEEINNYITFKVLGLTKSMVVGTNDYCNDISLAWPLILKFEVDITFSLHETADLGILTKENIDIWEFEVEKEKILREAMILICKAHEARINERKTKD